MTMDLPFWLSRLPPPSILLFLLVLTSFYNSDQKERTVSEKNDRVRVSLTHLHESHHFTIESKMDRDLSETRKQIADVDDN
jgi:hypothetical protein